MTHWLADRLSPGPDDTDDADARSASGRAVSEACIVCNVMLAAGKVSVGAATDSLAIVADGVNNLADAASNIVSLLGFRLAAKPPDAEHPYGHGRYEYLVALFVASGIMLIGVNLIRDAVSRIAHPVVVEAGIASLAVLTISVAVKLWMGRSISIVAARIDSPALVAIAADSRSDAIATSAVLATVALARLTGVSLDGWAGLAVGCLIAWTGIDLMRGTIDTLLGRGPSDELVARIRGHIVNVAGVLGVHGLMVHDYGPGRLFASAHVEMDPSDNVVEQHALVDAIERDIWESEHIVITLHVDPLERGNGSTTDLGGADDGGRRGLQAAATESRHAPVTNRQGGDQRLARTVRHPKRRRDASMAYKSKQMIVVRRDLKMRKGKIAAQAGHACVEATLMALAREGRLGDIRVTASGDWVYLDDANGDVTPLTSWFDAGVAKVCVYVDGEGALLDLAVRGREMGFLCALVRDAGITEFGGEPTYTCLAFEPLYPEQIDPLTGELPLY